MTAITVVVPKVGNTLTGTGQGRITGRVAPMTKVDMTEIRTTTVEITAAGNPATIAIIRVMEAMKTADVTTARPMVVASALPQALASQRP